MGGGPTLRAEAIASSSRGSRSEPGQNPKRLGDALLESQLALPLLIQQASMTRPVGYYCNIWNSPSIIPAQIYTEKVLPSLAELNKAYGICPPICMQIVRPKLHLLLLTAALDMQEKKRVASEEAEKRLKAALTAKREPAQQIYRLRESLEPRNEGPDYSSLIYNQAIGSRETPLVCSRSKGVDLSLIIY
ncbi:hypothetical protein EW026_g6253 [Hermanssonia centrifuga]|uniref:Uncharacterized protein n=1 Tax=Hermanssonia centrifuga TaxID=98765 RepID=A0A4S4KBV2_9APHY|nr:hypothetical protein EW026_g6253 [Hermanssonia centrifuga]